jgi:hypothetical protein
MKRLLIALTAVLFAVSAQAGVGESLISPDGKWTVYVVKGSGSKVLTGTADEIESSELWQMDSHGGNRVLLANTHNDDDMRYVVAEFNDLQFSTDGRLVYFNTPAWATSSAIHVVDTTTGKEHFVCAGHLVQVLFSAQGDRLVVDQKRYHPQGGSYGRKYLLTTDGREIRPVGPIEE